MRLKTGWTSSRARSAATSASSVPASEASRASEKPCAFSRRSGPAVVGRPSARTCASDSTIACNCLRNHGSMCADRVDLLDRHAEPQRLGAGEQPVRRRPAERGADGVLVVALAEARR